MSLQTIQHAKNLSLKTYQRDINYKFNNFSVEATTQYNNGTIPYQMGTEFSVFTNKCFFISVSHGLESLNESIHPFTLAKSFNMLNNDMIDTDNQNHSNIITNIVHIFEIKIECYVGSYNITTNKWVTTPYPSKIYGNNDKRIIRILNKGSHFEFLTKLEQGFVTKIDEDEIQKIIDRQSILLKENNITNKQVLTDSSDVQTLDENKQVNDEINYQQGWMKKYNRQSNIINCNREQINNEMNHRRERTKRYNQTNNEINYRRERTKKNNQINYQQDWIKENNQINSEINYQREWVKKYNQKT